jgi:hypothetical protein
MPWRQANTMNAIKRIPALTPNHGNVLMPHSMRACLVVYSFCAPEALPPWAALPQHLGTHRLPAARDRLCASPTSTGQSLNRLYGPLERDVSHLVFRSADQRRVGGGKDSSSGIEWTASAGWRFEEVPGRRCMDADIASPPAGLRAVVVLYGLCWPAIELSRGFLWW